MSKNLSKLRVSRSLRIRIGEQGKFYASISPSSGEFYLAPEVLSIICAIQTEDKQVEPQKIIESITSQFKKNLHNIPRTEEVNILVKDLLDAGILVSDEKISERYFHQDGFGDPWIQWAMLSDSPRCFAYEQAIKRLINSRSIVVDVGAGTGLLSALSLSAGAKHVLAIEETATSFLTKKMVQSVGFPKKDQIFELAHCNSADTKLPPATTHIVSELFGNDPFSEGVIPTLRQLGSHFKHQPVYIPQSVQVFAEVVDLLHHPAKHRIENAFYEFSVEKESEEINSPMFKKFLSRAKETLNLKNLSFPLAFEKKQVQKISNTCLLGSMPLNPPPIYQKNKHPLRGKKELLIKKPAQCPVGLIWFRVNLCPEVTLSSNPCEEDACEHWSPILVLLKKKPESGSMLSVKYELDENEVYLDCNFC